MSGEGVFGWPGGDTRFSGWFETDKMVRGRLTLSGGENIEVPSFTNGVFTHSL